MKPVILFRSDGGEEAEYEKEVASRFFPVYSYRSDLPQDSIVIGRYSVLPYYKELSIDIQNARSRLINSLQEHNWISSFDYYHDLKQFTPRSWTEYEFPYSDYQGPLVIKGRTNSRKAYWKTKMYAPDRLSGIKLAAELATDPLIGPQGLIYREYVPLKSLGTDEISGINYANEWRFFFYKNHALSAGYYWTTAPEEAQQLASLTADARYKAQEIAEVASQHATLFVIDIAETVTGEWILIEVNDGQMAGLSNNDPEKFYPALKERFYPITKAIN